MLSTRFLTALSTVALVTLGCGDSGSGGAGGSGSGGDPSSGGTPNNGGEAPVGGGADGGAPPAGGEAPVGGEAAGGAPGTGGGGGAGLGFLEACEDDADCESGICFTYGGQGLMLCTIECGDDNDCPAPSDGCNGMGVCKPPPN